MLRSMNNEGRMIIRQWEEIDKCRDETVSRPGGPEQAAARKDGQNSGTGGGLCWNFPRVKLRRLFNAKSLDDILGRNSGASSRKGTQSSGSSQSIQKNTTHSHSNLTNISKEYPSSKKVKGSSVLVTAKSENNCHVAAAITSSSSTGDTPATLFFTKNRRNQAAGGGAVNGKHHGPAETVILKHKNKTTTTNSGVKGAKSDNCLHRIVSSTSCTKVGSNSVDNLDGNKTTTDHRKVSVKSNNSSSRKKSEERLNNSAEKTHQKRKGSQVSPKSTNLPQIDGPTSSLSPSTEDELDQEASGSKMTKEKAKLVVANVGYLQRPLSPTPAGFSSSQQVNNNVFRVPGGTTTMSSPTSIVSPTSRTQQFYSPPGTQMCAKSSYSYHNYNNQNNKIKLDRPAVMRYVSPHRVDNERMSGGSSLLYNNNRGFSPGRRMMMLYNNNENISEGPASWSDSNHQSRFRPESPTSGFYKPTTVNSRISRAHASDTCDSTLSGRRIPTKDPKSDTAPGGVGTFQDYPGTTEDNEGMGDLQSPQYVKRTAHMFDSRYTSQVNGSNSGEQQRISSHNNQPSYLNVSRSVCGYSCLSYNNGTTTTASSSNGISSTTSVTGHKSRRTTGISSTSDFSTSSAAYRPGTLQATNGNHLGSNLISRRDPVKPVSSSPALDVENSQNLEQGLARKSNILEKIERLYGTNAVTTASLWRRPVPLIPGSVPSARASNHYKSETNGISASHQPQQRSSEKIIPILLESARSELRGHEDGDDGDDHHHSSYQSSRGTTKISDKAGDNIHEYDDDLYSKHQVLHSNRADSNGSSRHHTNGHEPSAAFRKAESPSSPTRRSLEPQQGSNNNNINNNNNSRPVTITSRIIREAASPSAKFDVKSSSEPSSSEGADNMGKDLFPTTEQDEPEQLPPVQIHKTEDTTDGEAKPVFRIVSNVIPREKVEGSKPVVVTTEAEKQQKVTTPTAPTNEIVKENISGATVEKNGEYFLKVLTKEKNRILGLIKTAESQLEAVENPTEEGSAPDVELAGQIFATIGKARLLINKKFKQFEGLCNDNIEQRNKGIGESEPFTTKNEDLEGFWDMVLIQVDQIHAMFQNLDSGSNKDSAKNVRSTSDSTLQTPVSRKPDATTKRSSAQRLPAATPKTPSTSKSTGNTARDESRRKMLAERRKAMKNQLEAEQAAKNGTDQSAEVQIFVHDTMSET